MNAQNSNTGYLRADSSMPWIGTFPDDWEPTPIRAMLKRKCVRVGHRSSEYDLLSLTLNGVIKRNLEGMKGKFPASFETYQEVQIGDFVFCLFDVEETPRAVGLSAIPGMITGAYTVYEPTGKVNSEFLSRVLIYCDEKKRFRTLYKGLRNTIPKSSLESVRIPVPSLEAQYLITKYLDHAELSLSKALQSKRELLKLLQERKEAIVNSRIIPSEVEDMDTEDSGIPGIGRIPKDWKLIRLKNAFRARDVRSKLGNETRLSVSSYFGVVERSSHTVTMFEASSYIGHKIVRPGDLVVNSLWAWARGLGVSNLHGLVSPVYGVYETKFKDLIDQTFIHLLIRSNRMQWQIQLASKGIWRSRYTITPEAFMNLQIPLPSIDVQKQIVNQINSATKDTDYAVQSLKDEIRLLEEYRSNLFAEVLTGRKNVLEAARKLPDLDSKSKVQLLYDNQDIDNEAMELSDD